MLSGASVASLSLAVENGEVVSQSTDLQGNASIRATVNGMDIINSSSSGSSPSSAGAIRMAAGPLVSSSGGPLSAAQSLINRSSTSGSTTGRSGIDRPDIRSRLSGLLQNAGQRAATPSAASNVASARFVIQNGEIVTQQIDTQGNGTVRGTINGQPFSA